MNERISTVSVRLVLRTNNRPKVIEGKEHYPIAFLIWFGKKRYYLSARQKATVDQWDNVKGNIKASRHPMGAVLRESLLRQAIHLEQKLRQAALDGLTYKQALAIDNSKKVTFTQHWLKRIEELYQSGDLGNHRLYKIQYDYFHEFMGESDVPFSAVDYGTLKRLEIKGRAVGNAFNTIKQRLKIIKAVWNDAKRRYPDQVSGNPFDGLLQDFRPSTKSTNKEKHQDKKYLRKLFKYEAQNKAQQRAVDMFLLAFYLRGAGIIDVLYFDPSQIKDGYYTYDRLKMPKKSIDLKVKLHPEAIKIIERHHRSDRPYLFDVVNCPRNDKRILEGNSLPEGTRQYDNARQNQDTILKRVSSRLELPKPLSMVQARHSWVIIARDLGINKELIEQAVGHKGNSVMDRHYFGRYDQDRLDKVNEKVIKQIIK